jgi:competence protein ComEC
VGTALGWWGVAIIAALALLRISTQPDRALWAGCAVAIVAALLGAWRADGSRAPGVDGDESVGTQAAIVVTAPVQTGQRQHFVVATGLAGGHTGVDPDTRVCVIAGAVPIVRPGDTLELQGAVESAADLSIGNRAAMASKGCIASMFALSMRVVESTASPQRALSDVRTRLGAVLRGSAPGDAGVLLSGLVTGDDDGFSRERKEAFIRTGTTHLTAVSGSNLALVASILATIGAATVGRHRLYWQSIVILGVWTYALVSGSHAPSLRAAIVATAAVLAFRFGRRPDFVTLILLAAGLMALLEPRQIESLGFRLSVAASLALAIVVAGLMATDRTSRLAVLLTASVAAQLATLPLLLPIFGTMALTSVPANIVAAPMVAIAMPLAALAGLAGLVWPPAGEVVAAPAALVATALINFIDVLGSPENYVSVGIPPHLAAAAFSVTALVLLLVIGGVPSTLTDVETLSSSAPGVVARENPLDALGAHLDHPEEQPSGKEIRHEVADIGQPGETISGEVIRHLKSAHPAGEPEDDHQEQKANHKALTTLSHHPDVFAAEIVES